MTKDEARATRRSDHFRSFREELFHIILFLYGGFWFLLLIFIGYSVATEPDPVLPDRGTLLAFLIAGIPLTASAVMALMAYRTAERRDSWRWTGIAFGLFVLGFGSIFTYVAATQ